MACPCCDNDQLIEYLYCQECGTYTEDLSLALSSKKTIGRVTRNKRKPNVEKPSNRFKLNPPPSPILMDREIKSATERIHSKETNRTLLEFQSKDGTLPEWRVQLQNAVRQRMLSEQTELKAEVIESDTPEHQAEDDDFFDNAEIIEVNRPPRTTEESSPANEDLLISALSRIEASREKYFISDTATSGSQSVAVAPAVAPDTETVREKTSVNFPVEEKTTIPVIEEEVAPEAEYDPKVDLYDTSELDPEFVPAKVASSFGKITPAKQELPVENEVEIETPTARTESTDAAPETIVYEDITAPFAFRFNAGLFDLLTSSFVSMFLMAPFVLLGGNWMSISGLFGFLTIFTIVSFLYLTTTVGLFGKSFGMHLFSLEMIHANGEEYPSFNQSAISSSLYLLSLASLGAGFITCLFDVERRAVHDIVSDTIIVREE